MLDSSAVGPGFKSQPQRCQVTGNVLTKIERRKNTQKLRGESVCRIIEMNVEVTGDDKFWGVVAANERKELKSLRKTENGLE